MVQQPMGFEVKKELKYDKDQAEVYLGAAIIGLQNALSLTLKELAKVHGNQDLSWFDNLKDQSVRIAKGTVAENFSIETDAKAVRFSYEAVDAAFESLRRSIIEQE